MTGEATSVVRGERPVTVRGSMITPIAWTALSAGVFAMGLWLAWSRDVFGAAVSTRVWTSGMLLLVGTLALVLSVSALFAGVRVFPDRLEVTRGIFRTQVIRPGELVHFRASGKGNTVISGVTARGRGFTTDRYHRHHDVLVGWLEQNAAEPWAEFSDFFSKLTVQTRPRPVYRLFTMVLIVGFFIVSLLMFPGLWVAVAYDDAHKQQVTCTITAAEAVTVSNRSTRGIGSSHPAVAIDTSECGPLTLSRGVDSENQDAVARTLNRTEGPHVFTVGGGSFWFRTHTPWLRFVPAPTIYSVDGVG
ncbi:hypothetical protein [Curtobacterium sp. MCBD17_023]|uniref:hypothetical protein n=1 Tax=Curtobacterium sp. MCBD17_023 TaxID=2175657 RepID=UPI0011B7448A|nr:hypothetical protein [Curtobacterium sp. MCBD17_023]